MYVSTVYSHPPPDVSYALAGDHHHGAKGAPCNVPLEVALNRVVHPFTIPDMGFRALQVGRKFDLVHVHAHPAHVTGLGERPLVMSEGSSPAIYLEQYLGWNEERLTAELRRSRRIYKLLGVRDRLLALERVEAVYVFSDWARSIQLRWGADAEKTKVIYPGFDTPPLPTREAKRTFRFLFVGRDFERKGGYELVEAFDRVSAEEPECRLTIAGSDPAERNPDRLVHSWIGPERRDRVLTRLTELQRAGSVELQPWLDRATVLGQLYPGADAFVMPTRAEGFGFTNVEAMSYGLPVISSSTGAMAEIVEDGTTGLLVPPGDVDALALAMLRLVRDRSATQRMGEAGRARFLERFTLERFRTELGSFYASALRR